MPDTTQEEIEADTAARIAAADQEAAEWGFMADKLATYWGHLMDAGMPKNLAGVLTINAQNHAHIIEDENEEP